MSNNHHIRLVGTVSLTRDGWALLQKIVGESDQIGAIPLIDVIDGAYTEAVRSRQIAIINKSRERNRAARMTQANRVDL